MPSNSEILQSFFDLGNRGDIEAATELMSNDLCWNNVGETIFSGRFEGKQAVMEQLVGPLFGRLQAGIHMTVLGMVSEGDMVVAETRGTARTHEGVDYNNHYCWVCRFSDGLICEVTEYSDTALIDRVFGTS